MILTDVIKTAVEAQDYVFINARRDIANVAIDDQPGQKVAILYDWTEELTPKKGDKMLSTFRCLLFVVEKAAITTDAEAIEAIVQRNRGKCKQMLAGMRSVSDVNDLLAASIGEVQNVFSSNYSGVDCEFRILLRDDDTEC